MSYRQNNKPANDVFAILTLICMVSAFFIPIMLRMQTSYDFMVHNGLVEKIWRAGTLPVPHPLYHLVTLLWSRLVFPDNTCYAGIATILLVKNCAAVLMFILFIRNGAGKIAAIAAAFGGVIATHIIAAYPLDHRIMLGYINPNVLHNPTTLMLAPIALAQFWIAEKIFSGDNSVQIRILAAVTTILSTMAKPSYLMVFIPALFLMAITHKLQSKTIASKPLLIILVCWLAISVPQYVFTYGQNQQQDLYSGVSNIIWLPFGVAAGTSGHLVIKLLASIAFPLLFVVLFPQSLRNTPMQFAWLTFSVSLVFYYFFAESGPRMSHGNFMWSAQIALYILLFESMRNFLGIRSKKALFPCSTWRYSVCLAIFSLHILSAAAYYTFEYIQPEKYW